MNIFEGETYLCWAFSISTMLRQSLKNFLKTLPASFNTQPALQKIEENEFHKRLRNELIMLPIPKAKFFDRKVPSGVNREDFKDEIIEKQTHVLQSAILRVSLRVSPPVANTFWQIEIFLNQKIVKYHSACLSIINGS